MTGPLHGPAHNPLHIPVLRDQVVAALAPRNGAIFVDGTFGLGGYASALLEAADCRVYGIDRDPDAISRGAALVERYAGRLALIQGRFGEMDRLLADRGVAQVDGVTLDLGVSSPQLDEAARGFSFRTDGPLDMRMEQDGRSAADIVNQASESELADIIFHLGEERMARRVARAIVAARAEAPIVRTGRLASIVRSVVPKSKDGIDPATRTFQGLRLEVNDELGELDRGLAAAEAVLAPQGRLAVVTFHSLEDRRVKAFLRSRSGEAARPSRHAPVLAGAERRPSFQLVGRKPVTADAAELRINPRARSAKLRIAIRTDADAWGEAA
ncbi:16S rRNA (cytosine(1402)-N(4))-methyltransferase RsmH [Oceanibaculum pacificum]|uniref:Ribosomal RNA small subunit methyltransferase H n=1 Tax=Oceanibaculum pacificum TaxID=580166 RepID=A0A154W0I6_9PROT|nr:16S rRNA (cytosine(1402)-N(4))-methyltransferase RsmH [Oceanibaculum pacificum]KZD06999.1 ribosomal RNA small subunit methyltransferase H [Oceanibaculum pacificum]